MYQIPPEGYAGSERVIYNLGKALYKNGSSKGIIDFGTEFKDTINHDQGVPIFRIGVPVRFPQKISRLIYNLNSMIFIFFVIIRFKKINLEFRDIDALHFHNYFQILIFRFFCPILFFNKTRPELILTVHSPKWNIPENFSVIEKIFSWTVVYPAIKFANVVTFESPIIRKNVLDYYKLKNKKNILLYNGVNTSDFNINQSKDELDINTIIWAARICEQKNHLTVADAIPLVNSQNPDIKFLFIGDIDDNEYYEKLMSKIKENNSENNIIFRKSVPYDELKDLYAKYAIHLVFSRYTGFDVALGENLATGRAIIASRIGPVEGVLIDRFNCLLVDPDDHKNLANAVLELTSDSELRDKISVNARKLAEERLGWDSLAEGMVNEILSRG